MRDGTDLRQITHQNDALLAQLDLPADGAFWFEGAEKTQVEGCCSVRRILMRRRNIRCCF